MEIDPRVTELVDWWINGNDGFVPANAAEEIQKIIDTIKAELLES
jgi:hypothetical protein